MWELLQLGGVELVPGLKQTNVQIRCYVTSFVDTIQVTSYLVSQKAPESLDVSHGVGP